MTDRRRLRVTLVYEYEVGPPSAYLDADGNIETDPIAMAQLDFELEPNIISLADSAKVEKAEFL